jgi:hypothetical protein
MRRERTQAMTLTVEPFGPLSGFSGRGVCANCGPKGPAEADRIRPAGHRWHAT